MNVEELSQKLNEYRSQHVGEELNSAEMYKTLQKIGFGPNFARRMAATLPCKKIGKKKIYIFDNHHIDKGVVLSVYNSIKKSQMKYAHKKTFNETEAINMLIQAGYRIKKPVKFDIERFKAEQPKLYREYCIYEYM